jgi:RND family efflux transporter MFP subunit
MVSTLSWQSKSLAAFVCVLSLAAVACGGGGTPAQGASNGPPPAAVEVVTIEPKPIADTSEFIATLQSLRSTTVQPEVEGLVTRIFVKSGDRVRAGDPVIQIDADRQVATVRSTEATRAGTEADVEYWRQQVKRLETLVDAGAISLQEFDQARNSLRVAEARLAALDAQLKEQRVDLAYHRVVAPQAGVIGDVPVRAGDRVTQSTVITTIDQKAGLELYIQVPLDRSPDLRVGLPIELLAGDGTVIARNPITFVAPRVDEATQTVLVKSALPEAPPTLRLHQFIRARIVWRSSPGITVPLTAVNRVSGQYFCFVAADGPQGGLVARQTPIEIGDVIGNDYVVRKGLKAGDRLIVSGIQKIGDGAPIQTQ